MVRSIEVTRALLPERGIAVGPRTAEGILRALLNPAGLAENTMAEVRGRGLDGEPTVVMVRANELRDAIRRA
jgi:hypothetical protein